MTNITKEQFEIVSDVQVRHRPTGTIYSTNRYPVPTTITEMRVNLNGGRETDDLGNVYDMADVKAAARNLLQKRADSRFGGRDST